MEQQNTDNLNQPNFYTGQGGNLVTPNSTPVLILGILSIVCCWCYGVISIVLGVIAVVLASSGEREYKLNPAAYSISSYKNLKAGKTCAVIGLCLAGLAILCFIIYAVFVGTMAFNIFKLAAAQGN
jgi:hypothetical protein